MMPTRWFLPTLVTITIAAPALAHADAESDPYLARASSSASSGDWVDCIVGVDNIGFHHFPSDAKVPALTGKVDTLDVGATPTVKQLGAACLAEAKRAPDASDKWHKALQWYVGSLREDIHHVATGGADVDYQTIRGQASTCSATVAAAVQILDPIEKLTYATADEPDWTGTVADAHQICEQAVQASHDTAQRLLAPYVKAGIKADKLATLEAYLGTYLQISGGESTDDPKKLAKANVWFVEFTTGACAAGDVTEVTRFQFDKKQKLVKTTSKDYCGDIPKKAFH
jgi:hypothetical protein